MQLKSIKILTLKNIIIDWIKLNLYKLKIKGDIEMKFYDFKARKMNGQEVSMEAYKGKILVVVNTASKCGLTPQFTELEQLNKKYKEQGLEILGFPCNQFANQDKGSNEEIQEFCSLNYGVTFNMFQKIEVNGENAHPLYKFLKNEKKGLFSKEIKPGLAAPAG